ncbi:serine hydrolase domain-containing protein [Rhizobium glycinendophyticum]|uniref:serine hydrolase domain-containing protein n=1 Tax=Rhizobium glycinendophyticum TaxID=2589807 RepID=UPI00142EBA2E|nr:serine hydrolase domain-containing protein [Rhizobium glycinendophyticum]
MSIAKRVSDLVDRVIEEERITGAVVLVYQDGKPLLEKTAGFADREAGLPVKLDTIFRYASVTKPFVAVTALVMVEKGLLRLDDRVGEYLPWFRPKSADGREAAITLRHLLTHTSGLLYDPALELLPESQRMTLGLGNTDFSLEENFSRHNTIPLAFEPGARWAYSFATDILGGVLAVVHGGTLEEAVVQHIALPLGMADARFHVTDLARLAVAYADHPDRPVRMPDPWVSGDEEGWRTVFSPQRIFNPNAFQSGGAGMVGTAQDVMRLLEMLRRGGAPLLSPDMATAALSNQIGDIEGEPGYRFSFVGGLVIDPAAAATALPKGAIQWGGVYGNTWFIDPALKLTVVSLTNNALEGCNGAYPEMLRAAVYDR